MNAILTPPAISLTRASPLCTWIIVASGPSLNQRQINLIQQHRQQQRQQAQQNPLRVLVINDNHRLINDADVLYVCDGKWWDWHINDIELKNFKGRKITQDKDAYEKYGADHNIEYIESAAKEGLSLDPNVIHQGANSGFQAINLAYHLGAQRALLIGYDMKLAPDGKAHWFGDHPDKVKSNYKSWLNNYKILSEHAKQIDYEIINCTPDSALECFEKSIIENIL